MNSAFEFLGVMKEAQPEAFEMATVYDVQSGNAILIFDGEETPSMKTYKRLGGYSPVKNDRVFLARTKNTYVILGKVI